MSLKKILILSAFFTFVFASYGLQNSSDHKVLFEKAKYTMETKGDLNGAIKFFERIIQKYPNQREYAAKSQLHIGICYEKLGLQQAQAAFRKVVENYPDQTEVVVVAREKLMTLTRLQTLEFKGDDRFHMRRIWEGSGWWKGCSVSPHGRFFAFSDRMNGYGEVAIFDLSSGKIRRLTDDATEVEGAYICAVSPDGQQIAYSWLNNNDGSEELRVMGINGSKPKTLYRVNDGLFFGPYQWSPDGKHILVYHKGIVMVSVDDGSVRVFKKDRLDLSQGCMRFSPDGRYIAYNLRKDSGGDIYILSTGGSYDAPLIKKSSHDVLLDWCPDGKSLLFRSDRTGSWDAWRIRVKDGRVDGSAELIKKDLGSIGPLGFSRDGSFYFMSFMGGMDIYTAKIDVNTGKVIESPKNPIERHVGGNVSAAWSPDGKYLAYIAAKSIHIRSEKTGEEKKISPQPGFYGIEWFPDGSALKVYGENTKGKRGLFRIDIETAAIETLLMQTQEAPLHRACMASDGETIYYSSYRDSKKNASIFAYDIRARKNKKIWRGERDVHHVMSSPDGQWLALSIVKGGDSSEACLAVMPANGGEIRELVRASSSEFIWTPDSKQLLFAKFVAGSGWGSSRDELWSVPLSGGTPKRLNLDSRMMWLLTINPDGERIAYTSDKSKAEIWVMENFLPEERTEGKNK